MAKKRGIFITIIILVAITGASFAIWFVPQKENSSFVITDFKSNFESIQAKQKVISDVIEKDFKDLVGGKLNPDDYINRAQTSRTQLNSLMIELIESKAPQEWQNSYENLGQSFQSYNDYLLETIVVANKIKVDPKAGIDENLKKLEELQKESNSYALKSNEMKP